MQIQGGDCGWFAYLIDYVMPACYWCKKRNISPVIDMLTDEGILYKEEHNVWEKFYEQPAGIMLTDAEKQGISRRICAANRKLNPWTFDGVCFDRVGERKHLCELWNEFIVLKPDMKARIDKEHLDLFGSVDGNVLGCSLRGTDYRTEKPLGHYRVPSNDEYVELIRKCCKQWDCPYIYVSTEDKALIDRVNNEFDGRVIYYDEKRFTDEDRFEYSTEEVMNYIISKALLARCDYLFGVMTGGTIASIGMNNLRFKDTFIYNNGKYGDEIPFMKRAARGVRNRVKKLMRRISHK